LRVQRIGEMSEAQACLGILLGGDPGIGGWHRIERVERFGQADDTALGGGIAGCLQDGMNAPGLGGVQRKTTDHHDDEEPEQRKDAAAAVLFVAELQNGCPNSHVTLAP
jgi:hypothetical protein